MSCQGCALTVGPPRRRRRRCLYSPPGASARQLRGRRFGWRCRRGANTLLDMFNPAHQKGPVTPGERNFVVLLATVILGLFVADIVRDYEPIKLTVLLFLLLWIPLLALHEAGHALMAALLGWYVGRVVIGVGRLV